MSECNTPLEGEAIIDASLAPLVNESLLDWFIQNRRELPFRAERDPYKIWVSEIMAQQTQISTIIPYYERFIKRFPTVFDLNSADLDEVLGLWQGLGYYSRARNLKRAAGIIAEDGFPETYDSLLKLPGVGPYTAGAVASIAYGERVPCVDGNVLRVISRAYASRRSVSDPKVRRQISKELARTMPAEDPGLYNESLMELGALVCTPKKPSCLVCPIRDYCASFKMGIAEDLPVKGKPKPKRVERMEALVIFKDSKPLFTKRGEDGLLSGLDGFPMVSENGGQGALELAEKYKVSRPVLMGTSKHIFTHRVWVTDVYFSQALPESDLRDFYDSPISVPTAFKKMLKFFKEKNSD